MLSSANKPGPTTIKQFVQPYFIEIAPDGAVTAVCSRFNTLLQKKNVHKLLDENVLDLFGRIGCLDPGLSFHFSGSIIPKSFDLSMSVPGLRPFIIRWTTTPGSSLDENPGGWQLTGMRIYTDAFRAMEASDPASSGRPAEDEIRYQAEQFVLKRYCWLQLRPKSKKSRPSIGRSQVAGLARGLGQRDVRHGSSMV